MSQRVGSFLGRTFIFVGLLTFGFNVVAGAETVIARALTVPQTIQISPELLTHVEAMLESSPTFRQQFERIVAAERLIVSVRIDPTFTTRAFRARSTIRRYDSGLLVVSVKIGPGVRQAEWIAHEFEHVIEQLDGLSLTNLADRDESGTWYSGGEMIETARAIRVGREVLGEMIERARQSDKFVE